MSRSSPAWKRLFDSLDQRLSPTINDLATSDDVATLIALSRRGAAELERRLEQASRRALHLVNLPAGSDVNRLLDHIARLEREVRDLRNQLGDRENAAYLAELTARHEADQQAAAETPKPTKRAPRKDQRVARHGSGSSGKKS